MSTTQQNALNPCSLHADEQIAAKIWELLRRNQTFRAEVQRLKELDAKERANHAQTGEYHGAAWADSCELVEKVNQSHGFAGVALHWLVPEPLFIVKRIAKGSGNKWRVKAIGEGKTPDIADREHWRWWRNERQANQAGHLPRRGPLLFWQSSTRKRHADKVNPLREWQQFDWPFTVEHSWTKAPLEFRRAFQFIWRSQFDSRPKNAISKDRSDSPSPHETDFFRTWDLADFRFAGWPNASHDAVAKVLKFRNLADNYRVFAIPCQLLTRQAAKEAFERLYLAVAANLPDDRHFFGTPGQWKDFLAVEHLQSRDGATRKHAIYAHLRQNYGSKDTPMRQLCQTNETDVTRRVGYIEQLRDLIFPGFPLRELLDPMPHRRAKRPAKG